MNGEAWRLSPSFILQTPKRSAKSCMAMLVSSESLKGQVDESARLSLHFDASSQVWVEIQSSSDLSSNLEYRESPPATVDYSIEIALKVRTTPNASDMLPHMVSPECTYKNSRPHPHRVPCETATT